MAKGCHQMADSASRESGQYVGNELPCERSALCECSCSAKVNNIDI